MTKHENYKKYPLSRIAEHKTGFSQVLKNACIEGALEKVLDVHFNMCGIGALTKKHVF